MPILSIIIPIYNVQDYLCKCLDSLVMQDFPSNTIEILLIDDGSIDSSGSIADDYSIRYPFITVIHQDNQGVSVARNNGLLQAKGEYIWFFDGDDWLDLSSQLFLLTEKLRCQHFDVVLIPVIKTNEINPSLALCKLHNTIDLKERFISLIPYLVEARALTYYCYDKIARRKLLLDNQIFFPIGILISEDFYWNLHLFKVIDSFGIMESIIYVYRVNREGAVTQQLDAKKINSILDILAKGVTEIKNDHNENIVNNLLIYTVPVWFFIIPEMTAIEKQLSRDSVKEIQAIYDIYRNHYITLDKYHRGAILLEKLVKIMGLSMGIRVYSYIINAKRTTLGEKIIKLFT